MGRRITRNLELEELLASRQHPELVTSPEECSAILIINLARLAFVLQGIRELLAAGAIYVTSGYRSLELHAAIYAPKLAPPTSRHLRGTAADFELEELGSIEAFVAIAKALLEVRDDPRDFPAELRLPEFDRLCLYSRRGHIHADIPLDASAPPARELYIDHGNGWTPMTYDEAAELLEAA